MVFYQNIRQTKVKEIVGTSFNLASPAMDKAMLASAETGNIEVLKLLIANGGEIIHDWRYIFQHTGTLKYTNGIANLTGGIGYLLVTIAVLWIFYMIARMAYEMFQKAIAPSSR